jgi:hypothetical protein
MPEETEVMNLSAGEVDPGDVGMRFFRVPA